MKWFKHESDARNSLKLRKVRRKYGGDGYAIYWFCVEAIAYEVDKDNLTFELKEDAETIGFELSIQSLRVEEIMLYLVNEGLFESSSGVITCLKLAERLDKSMTNSPKMRDWLNTKNVMTLADDVTESSGDVKTCAELEEKRKEKIRLDKNIKKHTSTKADNAAAQEIFNYWCQVMSKSNCKFSAKRKKKVIERLKDYSVDEIKVAIKNCSENPWYMGDNDKGQKYDDLELICRDSEKLEKFRDNPVKPKPTGPASQFSKVGQKTISNLEDFIRG